MTHLTYPLFFHPRLKASTSGVSYGTRTPVFVALSPVHPTSHARFLMHCKHHYSTLRSCRFLQGLFHPDFVVSAPWMEVLGTCILQFSSRLQATGLIQQCHGMQWNGLTISVVMLPDIDSLKPASTQLSCMTSLYQPTPPSSLQNESTEPRHLEPTDRQTEPRTNVYLSNLSFGISEPFLERVFSRFGPITSCKVLRTPQGISRKIAFINFVHPCAARDAVNSLLFYDSKQIRVSFAFNDYSP